jgi:hypothetical protein
MIALLTVLFTAPTLAAEDPRVSVAMDTGMRPLGLPLTSSLLGGGLRVGAIFGPLTPFAGGSATWISASTDSGSSIRADGVFFTGQAGLRWRTARLEAAETYLLAGALLADHALSLTVKDEFDRVDGVGFRSGLGGFVGGGADAALSDRVSIGVEAGVAYTGANLRLFQRFERESFDSTVGGGLIWTYTHLRLTWWIGGAS